jgi:hypothetical protein
LQTIARAEHVEIGIHLTDAETCRSLGPLVGGSPGWARMEWG